MTGGHRLQAACACRAVTAGTSSPLPGEPRVQPPRLRAAAGGGGWRPRPLPGPRSRARAPLCCNTSRTKETRKARAHKMPQKRLYEISHNQNSLNFNSQGKNFKRGKTVRLRAESYGFNPAGRSRRQAPRHMWGRLQPPRAGRCSPLPAAPQDFSAFFFFFKHGTWKMRSLFQVEKRLWPRA